MSSIKKRPDGKWRARYRDAAGREHSKHFGRKVDAQSWLDEETAKLVTGTWVNPKTAKTTVKEWVDTWLSGYNARPRSVSAARVQLKHVVEKFGDRRLSSVRPSEVKAWMSELGDRFAATTTYNIHGRMSQLFADAVHDGLIARSPVSRRTSPRKGAQRPYVATTAQVWALHDAMPEGLRPAVLLGAFAGLRRGEIVALRVADVDFMRGVITPAAQNDGEPLKTEQSATSIPIPIELALELNRMPSKFKSDTIVVSPIGRQVSTTMLNGAFKKARESIDGLPEGFRLHDLRHYYASLLIASGLDVKTVSILVRHASPSITLNVYGHLWPDRDETGRTAVAAVLAERLADSVRTKPARSQ
ncbi:tyrosine-type recombinase/integrase [Agromyces badenianii]|uniref:tyrosine-type recombinase/integrase n=1 Tax=Agromyces badenianii TaxID=2080742 RepID=UPI000D59E73F|nr:site-specific integrase [Agromyces badenianii]PWC05438.1 site-specific integrase [Agromyces badenianii]